MSGCAVNEKVIPPPELRSSSPLSQGDKGNGKRKTENIVLGVFGVFRELGVLGLPRSTFPVKLNYQTNRR